MIIIGTKKEIEAMIKEACPYCISILKCDGDCRACWNRFVSILIVRDDVSFLERLKEGDEK